MMGLFWDLGLEAAYTCCTNHTRKVILLGVRWFQVWSICHALVMSARWLFFSKPNPLS